ncbi:EscU/YscU/HrcU family type III secretion system export apparatus switch protein [Aeromicrobium phragmitis]|uniref:EscU/YscU/HrcU family type III secretion system export apparatus switch protein n=1 Tax=Aeromicrobium phragmitis TaxID=2478914 RepID=A0A3L8PP55_9ACTN|nr:EscU/YscU/HrcU family type III secretion system export apparatus switch protein [Aeromicrobium phragmitis]RLV56483.1 EscU/YscU/HrcU family type III secretion system export apparatus switch protein [Aeromicrobium phragmitis]
MKEEKTEKPTPKRRKESRKEGQVPRTPELGAWGTLVILVFAGPWLIGWEIDALRELMTAAGRLAEDPSTADALRFGEEAAVHTFVALLILSLIIMVFGVAAALAQGGLYLATKLIKPSAKKLNPVQGAKRIFGPQAWWEGAKMLLKSLVVGVLVYRAVVEMLPLLGGLVPVDASVAVATDHSLALLRSVALAGLVLAIADYAMQRHRVGKQTRMTKHEVKQETKQTEGDPHLKSAIRGRQIAVSRNRMIAEVPNSDVVLANPTHVAVALRYDPEQGAPRVVARGAGAVASRIRGIASEHDVPIVEDVPLARAIFRSTEAGQQIPAELFAAVAEVLAFVISRRTRGVRGGFVASPRSADSPLPVVRRGRHRRVAQVG